MKTTGILSALVFAHAAFAQASDSSSVAVSATSSPSAAASTTSASASAAIAGTSSSAAVSSAGSSSASASNTKTGTKSASYEAGTTTTPTSSSAYNNASGGSSTSVALAETQAPVSSSSGNPLVPDSASSPCTAYLNKLNSDTTLASCLTPLITAMSAYTGSGSGSASALSKTLNNLCASNACSASMMRSKLTEFKDACSAELTGANPDPIVVQNYDTLYAVTPFKAAICAKDADTQAYCVLNIGTGSSTTGTTSNIATGPSEAVAFAGAHLDKTYVVSRKRASGQTVVVNADTYRTTNLMYLFISPDMNAGELCTSCTQQIVSKYVAFESSTPYALGLKNSPLLGGQSDLWAAIQDKCPASFLSEVTNIAGAGTANQVSGASPAHAGSLITALAGLVAAGFAVI